MLETIIKGGSMMLPLMLESVLALAVAAALVTGAVLVSRPKPETKAEETAPEQFQAPRVKTVPRQRQAVV